MRLLLLTRIVCFGLLLSSYSSTAGDCPQLDVNIKNGTVNGLAPTVTMAELKKVLPCFTAESEEGTGMNCGGGVFYSKHDIYFYTGRDYIELRSGFKGQVSVSVLGQSKEAVTSVLGKIRKELQDGSYLYCFYKTNYGCLVVKFGNGKAEKLMMWAKPVKDVVLCL